jgi:hypothetical protein
MVQDGQLTEEQRHEDMVSLMFMRYQEVNDKESSRSGSGS